MEFLQKFGINWKVLIAQIINFLVLFYLLKRFVFPRFLEILAEREEKINKGLKLSEEMDKKISEIREKREKILESTREKARQLISTAREKIKREKEEILAKAREEAEMEKRNIILEAQRMAQNEWMLQKREYIMRFSRLSLELLQKILQERIDRKKDKEIIERFLKNL